MANETQVKNGLAMETSRKVTVLNPVGYPPKITPKPMAPIAVSIGFDPLPGPRIVFRVDARHLHDLRLHSGHVFGIILHLAQKQARVVKSRCVREITNGKTEVITNIGGGDYGEQISRGPCG